MRTVYPKARWVETFCNGWELCIGSIDIAFVGMKMEYGKWECKIGDNLMHATFDSRLAAMRSVEAKLGVRDARRKAKGAKRT